MLFRFDQPVLQTFYLASNRDSLDIIGTHSIVDLSRVCLPVNSFGSLVQFLNGRYQRLELHLGVIDCHVQFRETPPPRLFLCRMANVFRGGLTRSSAHRTVLPSPVWGDPRMRCVGLSTNLSEDISDYVQGNLALRIQQDGRGDKHRSKVSIFWR